MAHRSIDGPHENYLTIEEVSRETGQSVRAIRELIARGIYPRPALVSAGGQPNKWSWKQVVYMNLRTELLPYLRRKKKTEKVESSDPPRTPLKPPSHPRRSGGGANDTG